MHTSQGPGPTYEDGDVLEAVRLRAILTEAALILQHKGDLDDARQARRHQGVPEHLVRHGTDHEVLWMRRHGPAGNEKDEAWNEVTLGGAVAAAAKPDAREAGAPPNDAHGRVLPVVLDPLGAPYHVLCQHDANCLPGCYITHSDAR